MKLYSVIYRNSDSVIIANCYVEVSGPEQEQEYAELREAALGLGVEITEALVNQAVAGFVVRTPAELAHAIGIDGLEDDDARTKIDALKELAEKLGIPCVDLPVARTEPAKLGEPSVDR